MKTICFLVLYFGKLPENFQIWLNSCKYNPTINWIIFTDDKTKYAYPANVSVIFTTFSEVQSTFQTYYDFQISLSNPYKLCDYKVAYGEVFQEYIKDFDFWGYCDLDVVFGDIRKFLSKDVLNSYSKILSLGHFTLFLNNNKINRIYRSKYDNCERYIEVFSSRKNYSFDEYDGSSIGINQLMKANNISIYNKTIYNDFRVERYRFVSDQLFKKQKKDKNCIFLWEKGTLTRYFLDKNDIKLEETMYIHLQKRKMKNINVLDGSERIIIFPNGYENYDGMIDKTVLKKYGSNRNLYLYYWVKMIKRKVKNGIGILLNHSNP